MPKRQTCSDGLRITYKNPTFCHLLPLPNSLTTRILQKTLIDHLGTGPSKWSCIPTPQAYLRTVDYSRFGSDSNPAFRRDIPTPNWTMRTVDFLEHLDAMYPVWIARNLDAMVSP